MSDPLTINDLIDRRALETPDDVGFLSRQSTRVWRETSWATFHREVRRFAGRLASLGLRKGDCVAIIARTSLEWEIADKAVLLCGGTVVGIETHANQEHIQYILRHSDTRAVIVEDEATYQALPEALRAEWQFALSLTGSQATGTAPTRLSFWNAHTHDQKQDPIFTPPSVVGSDIALIVFTSGTTGVPNGIPYTHDQVLTACLAIRNVFPSLEAGGRLICWLPLANLFQRIVNLMSVFTGQRTYIWNDPRTIADGIREIQPTVFIAVPRFYDKVREAVESNLRGLSGVQRAIARVAIEIGRKRSLAVQQKRLLPVWLRVSYGWADTLVLKRIRTKIVGPLIRFCLSGSAPMDKEALLFFHSIGILILEAYALSENIVPMTINRLEDFRFGSVGKPVSPNEIKIGADGIVVVRGPGVCAGYWKTDGRLPARDSEGYLQTGDFGKFDDDGFLYLSGRRSELIKTSTGRRISPAWVDSVYRRSPFIDQSVVIGQGRSHLVVLVTLNANAVETELATSAPDALATRALISHEIERLNSHLAEYERARAFIILDQPLSVERGELTPSLKIRRHAIEDRYRTLIDQMYKQAEPS